VPAPKRTKFVMPKYPEEALARGERSLVVLEIVIDEEGKVAGVKVLHGGEAFGEAAREAAQQWRYEVTKVDGHPVKVRMTVPLSFAVKLPEMMRAKGIPELRQGATPLVPAGTEGRGAAVIAEVEISAEGHITQKVITSGDSPWRESLLAALQTWRFASTDEGRAMAFEVHADFKSRDGKVELDLTKPRGVEARAAAAEVPSPVPAPPASPPAPEATAAPAAPEPTTTPEPAKPAATATVAQALPPAPAAPTSVPPRAAAPPVEVVAGSDPAPPAAAAAREDGMSTIRDVELSPGIPDLVHGRRPVSPPLARMAGVEGDVQVRFSIDSGGATAVTQIDGPEALKDAADSLVRSWSFRRTAAHRVFALAAIQYRLSGSRALITVAE
jgi:TonB family protein